MNKHEYLKTSNFFFSFRAQFTENRTIFNTPNPRLMNVSLLKESKLFSSDRKSRSGSHSGSRSTRRISSSVLMAASAAAAAHLPQAAAAATEDCPPAPIQEESPDDHGRPKCARSKTDERNVSLQNKLMTDGKFSGSQSYILDFVLTKKTTLVLISKLFQFRS